MQSVVVRILESKIMVKNKTRLIIACLVFILFAGGGVFAFYPQGYDVIKCHGEFSISDVNNVIGGNFYVTSQKGGASLDVTGEYLNEGKLYRIDRTIIVKILPRRLYGNTMITEPIESRHYADTYGSSISPILFGINDKGFTALYSKRIKNGLYILGDSYAPRFICSAF